MKTYTTLKLNPPSPSLSSATITTVLLTLDDIQAHGYMQDIEWDIDCF